MQAIDFKNLDKRSKMQIRITAVLIVVLIVISINSIRIIKIKAKPEHVPSAALKKGVEPLMSKFRTTAEKPTMEVVDKYKDMSWGRDPFQLGEGSSLTGLKLQGITWHKKGWKAIINGEIVGVGDMVGQNKVIEIKKNNVVVNDGTNNVTLTID